MLRKRLEGLTRELHAVQRGDGRALHQTRVASRRLRELIPMLQLERGTARKLGRRLRKVTKRLGTVRELDVLVRLIDELHVSGRKGSGGLGRVGVAVSKSRDQERKRLAARLPIANVSRLARKLHRIGEGLQRAERATSKTATRSWRWAVDARVANRASHLADALADAGALYLPERLHGVRVAVKKLRYAVELATEAAGEKAGADLRLLKRSQDLLGRMHDLQRLIDRMRQLQALTPPYVTAWRDLDALVASLGDDCRRLHARYMRMREALVAVAVRRRVQLPTPTTGEQTRRAS